MEITKQKTENECGVCVLKTIYKHLFKEEISKEDILNDFYLSNKGISIYDLEIIASKININLESYDVSFEQLKNLNFSGYFITTLSHQNYNHFVICKRHNSYFNVYDSLGGKYKLYFDEFEKYYSNVFILFGKKIITEQKHVDFFKKITFFDLPNQTLFLAILIFFDILVLLLTFIGSNFLKISINFVNENIFSDFVFVAFYFGFIFVLENLIHYFLNLLKSKKIEELSKRNIVFYLNYLTKKNKMFFINVASNIMYQYPIDIGRVIKHKYIDKPSLYSDLFFSFGLICILTYYSWIFLIFALSYALVSIITSHCFKKYNEKNYENNNYLKNEIEINFLEFYEFLKNEKNEDKLKNILDICKNNYWKNSKQQIKNNSYYSNNFFIKSSIQKVIYIFLVAFSLYIIVNKKINYLNDISELIFLVTILNLFNSSTSSIFDYFSEYSNYKKSYENLNTFLECFNKKEYEQNFCLPIDNIKNIKILDLSFSYENEEFIFDNKNFNFKNNTLVIGKNGSGKSTLLKLLSLDIIMNSKTKYLVNDNNLSEIDINEFEKRIYYIPNDAIPATIDYAQILNKNQHLIQEISNFIKTTKISSKNKIDLSKGEVQMSNLFALLNCRNKIILLDESFSNVSSQNLEYFMKKFYPTIKKYNFVIAVSHDKKMNKYFDNIIEI